MTEKKDKEVFVVPVRESMGDAFETGQLSETFVDEIADLIDEKTEDSGAAAQSK